MASVTFPASLGGSGITISDDGDPSTGLAQGGHRVRFVPALQQTVAMAQHAREAADDTHEDRIVVVTARSQAESARNAAQVSATAAQVSATAAQASAQQASAIYPSVTEGMQATSEGGYFKVPEAGFIQLYRNLGGQASPVLRLASEEAVAKLASQSDPLLMSLLF